MKGKLWIISVVIVLILIIIQYTAMLIQHPALELRIVERNGIYIVQSNLRCGLLSNWDDEAKFRSKANAEKYRDVWYLYYRSFKESENKVND